jgi:hypothetical protein
MALAETGPLLGNNGLLNAHINVRGACLLALDSILKVHCSSSGLQASRIPYVPKADDPNYTPEEKSALAAAADVIRCKNLLLVRLWLLVHDVDEDNAAHASLLWERCVKYMTIIIYHKSSPLVCSCRCSLDPEGYAPPLLSLLSHPSEPIRVAAGRAIAGAVAVFPRTVEATMKALVGLYLQYAEGIALTVESSWRTRWGVLTAVAALAERRVVTQALIPVVLPFLINKGLADDRDIVRAAALNAGKALVDAFGGSQVKVLVAVLERFLEQVRMVVVFGKP